MNSRRYVLAHGKSGYILLSNSSADIFEHMLKHKEAYYSDIEKALDIPKDSQYVFVQRLEKAGLLKRESVMHNSRKTTVVKLLDRTVKKLPLDVIR